MAQRQAAPLTRAGPARTGVLIQRIHVDCLPLKVSSSSRPECTCQVGGAEELGAGSVREEVRSELANVVLHGQRLRRCASSSFETGDEDFGKRETADHCTGHHRLAMLLAKGVDSTATPVPGFQQVRAHIFRVIKARTRGPAPMAVGNLNSEFGGQ